MEFCISHLLVFGELTVIIISLSALIGIPFKISHVYLGNLRYVNGKKVLINYLITLLTTIKLKAVARGPVPDL